ncbi:Cas1p-domain-containing protein [Hypoxylon sp. NC0597]|nr:Cas1p-domain-containing protein [Hypoxylon sp. NC0597]
MCSMARFRRAGSWTYFLTGFTMFTLGSTMLLGLYRNYLFVQDDPYRCRLLFHDGTWSPSASSVIRKWEPKGCRMVEYSRDTIIDCMSGRKIILAGDSTIRQIFFAAARRLDPGLPKSEVKDVLAVNGKHENLSFRVDDVEVEFIWDPWLNSTALNNTFEDFHAPSTSFPERTVREESEPPIALSILGAPGLWAARYGGDDYLEIFKRGVDSVILYLSYNFDESIESSTSKADYFQATANQILLAPVQVPEYNNLSLDRSKTITPKRVHEMNDYLSQLSPHQLSHVPWVYNHISSDPEEGFGADGLHASDSIAALKLDIALNARCNAEIKAHKRSFKGTCCIGESRNLLYEFALILWVVTMIFRSWSICLFVMERQPLLQVELARAGDIIVSTLVLCWFCDGRSVVGKVERNYQQNEFISVCLLWLVASILTLRKNCRSPGEPLLLANESKWNPPGYRGPGYLSRDHSDEIKGLMQGFILLYHYHYASQTLWVYKIIRLFISGYLYLSGYGHTLYLMKTNNFSLKRIAAILFRLNFLSAILPYMMGTDYSSYYFASVITFWYIILFGMLRFFRSYNQDLRWLIMKVVATAILTDWLTSAPGVLETTVKALHVVFGMSWNPEEMRFRLRLDRYIIFVGVVIAALVHNASARRARIILPLGHAISIRPHNSNVLVNIICAAGIIVFLYLTQFNLHEKQQYNQIHPFVSWIPILCFVVLRNSHHVARHAYLALPAALGKISLETYVLQYHIWLGGDATAKLTFGLWEGR